MNLEELGNLYENPVFMKRICAALVKAANAVIFESADTEEHIKRLKFARDVLYIQGLPYEKARVMFSRILGNSAVLTLGNSVTDSDIEYIVNSLINEFI